MFKSFYENLKYARPNYILTIIFVSALHSLISVIISASLLYYLAGLVVLLILTILFVFYSGKKNRTEVLTLKKIIENISNNELKSPEEIRLGNYLVELESAIKTMFVTKQADISNLKKLEQVRTEFLGNVSHELRTPIFAIQGFIETLLNGAIHDEKVNMQFLGKAMAHTRNLNNLLNDLIDISMIESGQMRMSFDYFNVFEFLEAIVNEMKPLAEKKKLILKLAEIDKSISLFGDKSRIRQVMINLIQNAIKYSEKGKIEVIVEDEVEYGRIIVRDTGIGLSESDLGRIFERFYRTDRDRSRTVGGTGLGLSIVKHIIEAHKSKIEVKSKLGFGSQFAFRLKKNRESL
ncbi:MAG: ATP-binding protein [Bacteroidetes bacterium]|nr:ATP-binding protein [Bacteroidota bacterium]